MHARPGRRRGDPIGPLRADAGMITAEFVVVLPALVLALLTGMSAETLATMRMRCADAAAVGARLAARGESTDRVVAATRSVAPVGARVTVTSVGDQVRVTVTAAGRVPVLGAVVPGLHVAGSFTEAREPGPPP